MVFYHLSVRNQSFVEIGRGNDWKSITCSANKGHRRAGKRITDLHVKITSSKVVDFSCTLLADIVITDKVLNVIKKDELTGYEVRPVIINPSKRKIFKENGYPNLWEFITKGKGGYADQRSRIYLKYECETCSKKRYSAYENGIVVDCDNWDGTDFFTVIGYPKKILVTEKVRKVFEQNYITNVEFIPSHELEWPEHVIKP